MNIWELCSIRNDASFDRVNQYLQKKIYSVNDKTVKGLNTPLHFAVYYENLKMIKLLTKDKTL